jgi:hypothetical protein
MIKNILVSRFCHLRVLVFLVGAFVVLPLQAQLYLITGSPTPKHNEGFASALFRVGEAGTITKEFDIAAGGTEWIGLSYESESAVVLGRYPDNHTSIIDMSKASLSKRCENPPGHGMSLVNQWLAHLPDRGLTFVEHLSGNDPLKGQLVGMIADPALPCENSFVTLDPTEIKYVVAQGKGGVADVSVPDGIRVTIDLEGKVIAWVAGIPTYPGFEIPVALRQGLSSRPSVWMLVNNSRVAVFSLFEKTSGRAVVFRKRDGTWRRLPDVSGQPFWLKGFGDIVAMSEARVKSDKYPASAGPAGWRKHRSDMGPNIDGRLHDSSEVFPGRLQLYDTERDRVYAITTNQGDSEVLLVDKNVVYYRVSDRLYSTEITVDGLAPARLIATSEVVRDTHWAFIVH